MARLRAECGWKAAQTHRTLAKHLLEETYETLEAIDTLDDGGSPDHLREELGDVLLQVYLHAAIAARDRRRSTSRTSPPGCATKMIRRNPHVFGDVRRRPTRPGSTRPGRRSRPPRSSATGSSTASRSTLPALTRAAKVLDRLERAGRALPAPDPDDLGDRLLALVVEATSSRGGPRAGAARRRTTGRRVSRRTLGTAHG